MGELQDIVAGVGEDLFDLLEDTCDIVTLVRTPTKGGGTKTTTETIPDVPCAFFTASNAKVERSLGASVAPVSYSLVYLPLTQPLTEEQLLVRDGIEYAIVAIFDDTFEAFTRAYVTKAGSNG
jgi:hypothetical protein